MQGIIRELNENLGDLAGELWSLECMVSCASQDGGQIILSEEPAESQLRRSMDDIRQFASEMVCLADRLTRKAEFCSKV